MIAGSATGIGAATARRLAADGATVVLGDLNLGGAEEVAGEVRESGGDARAVELDVSREDSVVRLVATTMERHGRIDILHNNAADLSDEVYGRDGMITEADLEVWDRTLSVNLRGVVLGCKHVIPHMVDGGRGVIVNTSSQSALAGGPGAAAYGASKSAINSVTLHVAARYGKFGVRSVAVAPGLIFTDHVERSLPARWKETMRRHECTPEAGRPDDVANVVSFLVSDEASFITGVVIPVDGGASGHRASLADELELADLESANGETSVRES